MRINRRNETGFNLVLVVLCVRIATSFASFSASNYLLENVCLVEKVDVLIGDDDIISENDNVFECFTLADGNRYEIEFSDDDIEAEFRQEFSHLTTQPKFLGVDPSWVDFKSNILRLPTGATIESFTHEMLRKLKASSRSSSVRGLLNDGSHEDLLQQRHLSNLRNVTDVNRNVMIVARITTNDATPMKSTGAIDDAIFGAYISFKQQMNACSFGNIDVSPFLDKEPVLDIYLNVNITDYGYSPFFEIAERAILKYLKRINASYDDTTNLHAVAEFVVLAVPFGLKPPSGTPPGRQVVAGSKQRSYKSVIVDAWINEPMVTLHQIG